MSSSEQVDRSQLDSAQEAIEEAKAAAGQAEDTALLGDAGQDDDSPTDISDVEIADDGDIASTEADDTSQDGGAPEADGASEADTSRDDEGSED